MTALLKFKKLHPDAVLPAYATSGAACFDLSAIIGADLEDDLRRLHCSLPVTFGTGLAVEVPPGFVLKIYSRSGHGFKHGLRLANGTGIIDSDYRGEIMVRVIADDPQADLERIMEGERRIAQAMLERVEPVTIGWAETLTETARGAGGLGSTGN